MPSPPRRSASTSSSVLRAWRGGVLVPLTARKLAHDDATHTGKLSDLLEVEEGPVDPNWSAVAVLDEEDGAVEVGLPRGADRVDEVDQTPADQATVRPAPGDRDHRQTVAILRYRTGRLTGKDPEEPIGGELRRRRVAEHRQARPVERRESRPSEKRRVQRRDVGEADERLWSLRDRIEVEQRDHLGRAVAAAHGLDRVDLVVGVRCLQVAGTHIRVSRVTVVPL